MEKEKLINVEQKIYEVFKRRYIIIGLLGIGGMGCVFYAKSNDSLTIERAIKVLDKKEYNENLDILAEAYALKNLDHPNIPKVIEITEDEDFVYIVQEYVKGDSLKMIVKNNGKIEEKYLLNWMNSIAMTLNYLHNQGIIHRDIKPDNIMLTPEGQIKIIDFGLARSRSEIDEVDEKVIGTLSYTAPERFSRKNASIQTDIYGFGTTVYYLASGLKPESMKKNPRRSYNIMKNNFKKHTSPSVAYILSKAIAIDPNQRYYQFETILYDIAKAEPFNQSLKKQSSKEKIVLSLLIIGFLICSGSIVQGFNLLKIEKEEKYQEMIEEGSKHLENGKVKDAIKTFESSIEVIPDAMPGYQGVMESYTKEEDYEKVIDYALNLSLKKEQAKKSSEIEYLIGNAYYELEKYQQALPYLKSGVELNPIVEHNLVLGMNYCALENYEKAQEIVNAFKETVENTDAANYLLAQIYERQEKIDLAKENYNEVITSSKKDKLRRKAYLSLARINKQEKNYQEIVNLMEAWKIELAEKEDIATSEYLGEAYFALAKNGESHYYEQSKNAFESLLNLGYTRPYLYRNLAIIDQETGDYESALDRLSKMSEEYPEDYTAELQKAWVLIQIENNKLNEKRDYTATKKAYDLMMEKAGNEVSDTEIQMLRNKIYEINSKGW